MIVVRLLCWMFRVPTLPVVEAGRYVPGKLRVPTFGEAVTGVSMT